MKKGLIKAGVLVAVFFAALIGFSLMTNQTNKDLTTDMANATLPMIDLYTGTQKINELHGYTVQMDASYMRDTITPVGTDMKVPATIQTFGTDVDAISYKIRSMDGKDLIADGMAPGPELGEMLEQLLQLVLDEPSKNRREVLMEESRKIREEMKP